MKAPAAMYIMLPIEVRWIGSIKVFDPRPDEQQRANPISPPRELKKLRNGILSSRRPRTISLRHAQARRTGSEIQALRGVRGREGLLNDGTVLCASARHR